MSVPAPNFTQTPNRFYELLPELSEGETKVGLVIIRATFGWHKERDRISYSQFEALTGMATATISKALKSLQDRGLIDRKKEGRGYSYGLIVDASSSESEEDTSSKSEEQTTSESEDTKERAKESDDEEARAREQFGFLTEEEQDLYQADLKELLFKYPKSSSVDHVWKHQICRHHTQSVPRQWLIAQGQKLAEKHGSAEAWERILAAIWITGQKAQSAPQKFMASVLKTLGKPKKKPSNVTPISKGRQPKEGQRYKKADFEEFVANGSDPEKWSRVANGDPRFHKNWKFFGKKVREVA